MANTNPVTDTAEAAAHLAALGRAAGSAQVVPVGAVSKGLAGAELAELGLMARSGAQVRVFSDDGHCVADARLMRRALEYVRAFDGVVAQHAQDPRLAGPDACCHEGEISGRLGLPGWPAVAESSIVARDVQLAELTRSRVHVCHVSTAETVEVLRWAKARGINVTAEVTPHHLLLTTDEVQGYDPTFKVNPPLRPDEHVLAVRDALSDGTIDAVATDHAPHARHDKEHAFAEAAFGMLGPGDRAGRGDRDHDQPRPLRLARAGRADVDRARAHRPAARPGPTARPSGEPGNVTLVDPDRPGRGRSRTPRPRSPATTPGTAATSPTLWSPPSGPAASPTGAAQSRSRVGPMPDWFPDNLAEVAVFTPLRIAFLVIVAIAARQIVSG